jgi:RNA recognition motif-containing protein
MKSICVGNLSYNTSEENLRVEFAKYGQVTSVKIVQDEMTRRPRGFGFVEMVNDGEAANAIAGLNGANLDGRTIVVNEARPKREHRDTGRQKPRVRFGS